MCVCVERRFMDQRFPCSARIKHAVFKISWTRAPEFPYFSSRLLRMYKFLLFKNCFLTHTAVLICFTGVTLEPFRTKKKKGIFISVISYIVITRVTTKNSKFSVLETTSVG